MRDVEVKFAPADGRFRLRLQRPVDGCESLLDQLGRGVAAGALVSVQRHADVRILRAEQPADRGKGIHGMGEVIADAAQAVVELGRPVNGHGHHEARPDRPPDLRRHFRDPLGGDAIGGKMREEKVGTRLGERLHDLREIRAVGGFASGEVDPLQKRIGRRDGLHLVQRQFVVQPARSVLHLPDVAIRAARVAAFGDDEVELGGAALGARGLGGGAQRETTP